MKYWSRHDHKTKELQMLKLTRSIVCFDVESTGVDPATDRIITLDLTWIGVDGLKVVKRWLVKPPFPIPPESTKIHGITDEMVAMAPAFEEVAEEIRGFMMNVDLLGFNLLNFDIPILWEEFYRAGIVWDLKGVSVIDAGNIFKKKEERTLTAAVKFYCGRVHDSAHNGAGDVAETIAVLEGQLARYPDLASADVATLATFSAFDKRVDLAGKIVLNEAGVAVYNFGKAKGVPVVDDPGFGRWILNNSFSENTKQAVNRIFDEEDDRVSTMSAKEKGDLF